MLLLLLVVAFIAGTSAFTFPRTVDEPIEFTPPTDCLFIHGTGEKGTSPATDSDTTGYWGGDDNIVSHTPGCTSRSFFHHNTIDYAFDDPVILNAVTEFLLQGSTDNVVHSKRIFTHSFGNNVLAAALRKNLVSFDPNSTLWFSANAPWKGSKAASVLKNICSGTTVKDDVLGLVADELNYCKDVDRGSNSGMESKSYASMMPGYSGLDGLADVANIHVNGALCGISARGLGRKYSDALELITDIVHYGNEETDGMVGIDSCLLEFQGSSASETPVYKDTPELWYTSKSNHADGTCQNGNKNRSSQQPCDWYAAASLAGLQKTTTPAVVVNLRGSARDTQ